MVSLRGYATRLPQKPPIRHPDPLSNQSNAVTTSLPEHLTFIHRPPPSPPTPFSLTVNPSSPLLRTAPPAQSAILDLPPQLKKPALTHPRLSEEAIADMRRLRTENPSFGCSPSFVSYIAPLTPSRQRAALAKRNLEHEKARARWGEKASLIREICRKRKEFW
ncbi:hypothetical protein F5148DRAFT_1278527 [Russula earlei]|uniref:Uncharacterized protein n=1 Tax=Russula earlei TaxID=71964 RepID=A0ACC0TSE0_9AGAM|nr:hypothetical protein F5148DRAFT_1278527 [Russula earlei]